MRVYWFVATLAFIIQFYPIKGKKQYWWRTVISFFPLFLFMALRKDYGHDEITYHYYFELVHNSNDIFAVSEHMEPGYAVLNKIMPSYQALVAFTSLITCLGYSYIISRFVPQKFSWLAILLLFSNPSITVYFMMAAIRNALAGSLLMLSCYFLENKKRVPYIILGAIAMSIHTSALVMFTLCYFIANDKPITRRAIILWIIVLLVLTTASLSAIANGMMPVISIFMERYVSQIEGTAEIADERGYIGALVGILFAAGILLFQYLKSNKDAFSRHMSSEYNSIKYKLALIYAASFTIGMLGVRMEQYMIYYFIAAVTSMFAYWKGFYKYFYLLAVIYFFRDTYLIWISNPEFSYDIYTSILGNF